MKFPVLLISAALLTCWPVAETPAATNSFSLNYAPAPVNNPLKGFIPYQGSYSTFPYSMEWNYLSLRSLMTGLNSFNWSALDNLLNSVASRGHQAVFRIYVDYPTLHTGIPQFVLDAGLTTYSYTAYGNVSCSNYNNSNMGNCGGSVCPDYSNPTLRQALTNFIAAFGARYDGDPRIGFITVGLLGFWGEWHTYPEPQWFASPTVQNEVLSAYQAAFTKTKLEVRYANGTTAPYAIGYHDDSFAYDTLPPSSGSFYGGIQSAGVTGKWQTQAIGGEVYPPVQSCLFNSGCTPAGNDFSNCVAATHATWMLNQGAFSPGYSGAQQTAALAGARQMGYELFVTNATLVDAQLSGPLTVTIAISNTAVAPFYYNWPVQLRVLNSGSQTVQTWTTPWQLTSVLPGARQTWSFTQTNHGLALGQYKLLMGVPDPLSNGPLFRFANQSQDADLQGWLTLGTFSVITNSGTGNPPPQTNTFTVDRAQNWIGYLSYYNGSTYLGGSNAPLSALRSTFIPTQATATRLLLQINTNSYPAIPGSYTVESDTYVDTGTNHDGEFVVFNGRVESNSIPASWLVYAFIKDYTSNYGSLAQNITTPLVAGASFSITSTNPIGAGHIFQYGFGVSGSNAAPASAAAQQAASIVISNTVENGTNITVNVDPALAWIAGLNYYSTSDAYLGYQTYTLPQNPAVFIPNQANASRLLLGINTDTYSPGSAWNAADGTPLRHLETDTYVDPGTAYGGRALTFTGTIESNSLPAGWTAYAVIKEYTSGYASFLAPATSPLPASGAFAVSRNVTPGDGVQYGFYVYGPNTAPGSANAQQHVSIVVSNTITISPVKITPSLAGSFVTLSFHTQSGVAYTVQYKTNLTDATWQPLTNLNGNGNTVSPSNTIYGGGSRRFYRVMAQPQ